ARHAADHVRALAEGPHGRRFSDDGTRRGRLRSLLPSRANADPVPAAALNARPSAQRRRSATRYQCLADGCPETSAGGSKWRGTTTRSPGTSGALSATPLLTWVSDHSGTW